MAAANINLAAGQKADRKLEMIFVDVGGDSSPEWEIQGRGVEEAAVEFNHDVEQKTDILGITDTDVSAAKPVMELDPNSIRGGQKLSAKLLDIERRNAVSEFGTFSVLHVHCYLGEANGPFTAELHKNCTVVPQSLGGSNYVDMPISIYLSNDKTLGTVTIENGVPTFTEDGAGA